MNDFGTVISAALVIGLVLYLPRKISRRRRLLSGLIVSAVGWGGILLGVALSDRIMQTELAAYAWMGTFTVVIVLGIVLFVPAAFEWLIGLWPRRQRHEKSPNR